MQKVLLDDFVGVEPNVAEKISHGIDAVSRQVLNYFGRLRFRIAEVNCHYFEDNGRFPNNSHLPVLVYRAFLELPKADEVKSVEQTLQQHHWKRSAGPTLAGFHHYHSTAHKALAIWHGGLSLELGGPGGEKVTLEKGDLIVLPAGTAHRCLYRSPDLGCTGALPVGQEADVNYGNLTERPRADRNIRRVALPLLDPCCGKDGPLFSRWNIPRISE